MELLLNNTFRAHATGLNTAAKDSGLDYFGSATDNPELDDASYVEKLGDTQDFGQITVGNSQKVRISYLYLS